MTDCILKRAEAADVDITIERLVDGGYRVELHAMDTHPDLARGATIADALSGALDNLDAWREEAARHEAIREELDRRYGN